MQITVKTLALAKGVSTQYIYKLINSGKTEALSQLGVKKVDRQGATHLLTVAKDFSFDDTE